MTALDMGCPTGCGRPARAGQLLCPRCWAEVPKDLQAAVYRTWRAYSRTRRSADALPPGRRREILEEYRAARDAAIGSIR